MFFWHGGLIKAKGTGSADFKDPFNLVLPFMLLCDAKINLHASLLFVLYRFSPEAASRRGLSTAEMNAVEAIHRAVEFNPHVPKVSCCESLLLFGRRITMNLSSNLIAKWCLLLWKKYPIQSLTVEQNSLLPPSFVLFSSHSKLYFSDVLYISWHAFNQI